MRRGILFMLVTATIAGGAVTLGARSLTFGMPTPVSFQGRGPTHPATPAVGKPATPPSSAKGTPKAPPDASSQLASHPQIATRLQPLLGGMDIKTAAAGFKNLGEFVAALHVAKNLDIPFAELKAKITGPSAESLGQAIQALKPSADAGAEVKTADAEAKADLAQGSGQSKNVSKTPPSSNAKSQ